MISVFGAGGDRDRDKRPKMGRAGAELSDLAIVTSDNPRSEDPEAIIAEIVAGIEDERWGRGRADRRAAIALALGRARPGDTVVIAGKGHEQGQEFEGGRKIPFDDREVARAELGSWPAPGEPRCRARSPAAMRRPRSLAAGRRRLAGARRRSTPGTTGPGDLFFGLRGEQRRRRRVRRRPRSRPAPGASSSVRRPRPRAAGATQRAPGSSPSRTRSRRLQALARAWRRELGARVVGVTGSVGKTSVKDIARALLPGRVHANRENLNTEIGLPLTVLEAPAGTDVLVLEMAMRGPGQIAELAAIAEPDVAVITNVGPVHVELLGSVEAIAAAKAEVLAALPADGAAVVPADAAELEPHLAAAPRLLRFGPGGDVEALEARVAERRHRGADRDAGGRASASTSPSPRRTT